MSRTYGETTNCAGCRFWSEMLAQCSGGPVEAMCLVDDGPFSGKYVTARHKCNRWKSGHFGAIDDPPNYGEENRALYAEEDGERPQSGPAQDIGGVAKEKENRR